jgi:ubiquilin
LGYDDAVWVLVILNHETEFGKVFEMSLHLTFKPSGAANFELDFEPSNTIAEVKAKCAESCGIEKDQQKIIFKGTPSYIMSTSHGNLGRILKDEETLGQHGVQTGNVLHLVKGAKPGQPTDTPAATTSVAQPTVVNPAQPTGPAASTTPASFGSVNPAMAQNMAGMLGQMPQGMGGMGGMGMDPQMMSQLMQTPMFQQMMTAMSQNPQMMAQMMQMNPMVQQMAQQNPQVAMLLQNPQLMQQLMNPQTIQAMLQMQQVMGSLQSAGGQAGGNGAQVNRPSGVSPAAGGQPDYASMMASMQNNPMFAQMLAGGAAAGGAMPLPPAALAEFEQRFASELTQLEALGFTDRVANIEALRVCDGNVELAINYLFDLTNEM